MSLSSNISDVVTTIAGTIKSLRTMVNGNDDSGVGRLETTATTLVDAINEVKVTADSAAGGGVAIDDDTPGLTTTYSSSKIEDVVDTAVTDLVGGAPDLLNTLNELAAALDDDEAFATTVAADIAAKAPLASPTLTGTPLSTTPTAGDNSTKIATTAFVKTATDGVAVAAASETVAGKVELATTAEVVTGTDTSRAVTAAGVSAVVGDYTTTTFVQTFTAGLSA